MGRLTDTQTHPHTPHPLENLDTSSCHRLTHTRVRLRLVCAGGVNEPGRSGRGGGFLKGCRFEQKTREAERPAEGKRRKSIQSAAKKMAVASSSKRTAKGSPTLQGRNAPR